MVRRGRRPGQGDTREDILAAARTLFARHGYDGASIRAIAAEAGVNPALPHHFFGTKQRIFVAAMNLPVDPAELVPQLLAGPPDTIGEELVRTFLAVWGDPHGRAPFLALLRSVTTNESAGTMMRQFIDRAVIAKVAEQYGIPKLRISAAAAQLMGLALMRYVLAVPALVEASDEEIVELIGPTIQRYLSH